MQAVETNSKEVVLSTEEQSFIAELQAQIQTALRLIVRQKGLQGNWTLDGNKLVQVGV
jgi:hypothetical protein